MSTVIDTQRLSAILAAAQSPSFRKLLEDQEKAKKAVADAEKHLAEVEAKLASSIPPELAALLSAGDAAEKKSRKPRAKAERGDLKRPDLQELKEILSRQPAKTLNIRGEGYDTPNIKILADANPHLLRYEKGTWPKVTLLK
jgi:hypothetical protein